VLAGHEKADKANPGRISNVYQRIEKKDAYSKEVELS
jgi:hypothetical protein